MRFALKWTGHMVAQIGAVILINIGMMLDNMSLIVGSGFILLYLAIISVTDKDKGGIDV